MSEPEQTIDQREVAVLPAKSGLTGENKTALAMFGLLLLIYVLMVTDRFPISLLARDIRAHLGLFVPNMFVLTIHSYPWSWYGRVTCSISDPAVFKEGSGYDRVDSLGEIGVAIATY
jgi:hypothetical protein